MCKSQRAKVKNSNRKDKTLYMQTFIINSYPFIRIPHSTWDNYPRLANPEIKQSKDKDALPQSSSPKFF